MSDARGLYIEVFPTGGMVWRCRYRLGGQLEKPTLGKYPALTLRSARLKRDEAAQAVAMGHSPAQEKQRIKVAVAETTTAATFGERYFSEIVAKDRQDITIPRRYFDKAIVPAIGDKPVREVTTEDRRAIIWKKKDQGFDAAAGAICGVLKQLFDFALTARLANVNPVLALPMRHVHKAKSRERALAPDEIAGFPGAAYASNIRRQFKLARHLILLPLVRTSELLGAHWAHVDFAQAQWRIPSENCKTGKPHIVYLSTQAIGLCRELHLLACGSALVLPGRSSLHRPFADNAHQHCVEGDSGGAADTRLHHPRPAAHGVRPAARERRPSDVVEKALNHTIGGVRGVYNRAEHEPQRRQMLQFWADDIDRLAFSDNPARRWQGAVAEAVAANRWGATGINGDSDKVRSTRGTACRRWVGPLAAPESRLDFRCAHPPAAASRSRCSG